MMGVGWVRTIQVLSSATLSALPFPVFVLWIEPRT